MEKRAAHLKSQIFRLDQICISHQIRKFGRGEMTRLMEKMATCGIM
ncbi:hypothetical protein MARINOS108_50079 [Marinoscillum sp. 108]|nr:hypothetical protein MARINOS108_50079 [Marinoscillum sp. 108]